MKCLVEMLNPGPTLIVKCVIVLGLANSVSGSPRADDRETPEPAAILTAAIDAMGGKKTLEELESSRIKGQATTPMGAISLEAHYAAPNKFLVQQSVPGMGQAGAGSDGETAWTLNPMVGYELLNEEQAKEMQGEASLHDIMLRIKREHSDFEIVDRTTFHDQDAYKMRMLDKEEAEQFAYFSIDRKFLIGMEITRPGPMGQLSTSTMRFEQWEKFGDITMFTRLVMSQAGMNTTLTFEEIEFNNVDHAVFTVPGEVRRLVERREQEQGTDEQG